MTHLLHIDSSARGEGSASRRLSAEYVQAWKARNPHGTVTYRDLAVDTPDFVSPEWITGVFGPAEAANADTQAALQGSERLIREIEAADVLVLGVPMYNFGVPAILKAWIDQVVMAGRTFAFGENGPEGLLKGKKAIVLRASGSDFDNPAFAPMDFHAPYIRGVLGWIGITDVELIAVNGFTPEQLDAAVREAGSAIAASVAAPLAA
ncbi:NAD(P)H-dependent oxidoreductase (plasmid) [Streptomyces sp. NBC_01340]|uniref:FMN-dependent NADH-azoreductase n=1 Tax=unclassified Streptomyces TaxID=2593676 RepID=UPI0022534CD9|nr:MULTISPECIES: NAD(P)H-dependent oxidoreductase [unclassified Streptomyces]MCX4460741.1 NAD(P)H-dependent oxidoreductase [Streptomyces sp. NBC_01719]MCX4499929.1 NAD(P)H-dependent oxidoreductase [Streptomyces sp. NBC_01728]WSI45055.1 NAD(P)H-dependent oxidoreductase [Streptomyces sp. NBC_01340]